MSTLSSIIAQFKKEVSRIEISASKIRSFAFLVGGVLVALGLFAFYRGHHGQGEWLVGVGGILALIGVIRPSILTPLYRLWMGLAITLGMVVGNMLLVLFYFVVMTPIGLLKRLFRHTPADKWESYWIHAATFKKESLERPF
ncbi:MAG: hypothetical protein A3D65_04825 [Candidatus Lloydbacteria bacterium RIFCSPHIGHO2_02_FULL_50_13]|uniref:SxtJ n=1 Tax=Candidatus Lloydbacteria bacterium RIFCSPHIGHO2_02_FULL_50_13 TaxID=1798661 RepID=A0A1G2D6N2_9BACT|nr:MAG: hypothetical protein A3D65_04825 [Candidatus Lloydbacteria bacterium RIFCSPHIGHO2_02_FULL_50_13]